MPYLRLTKASLGGVNEFQVWFREEFFDNLPWTNGVFGKETDLEKCKVVFNVTFQGKDLGKITFDVTHGPHRHESNNTPNTWIHWPQQIQHLLHINDLSGQQIVVSRGEDGQFSMRLGS